MRFTVLSLIFSLICYLSFSWMACDFQLPGNEKDKDADSATDDVSDDDDGSDDDASDTVTSGDVWLDSTTGLTWQVDPQFDDRRDYWDSAKSYCEKMEGGGFTDWRLPTITELRSLVRGCPNMEEDGECGVSESCIVESCLDSCTKCYSGDGPTSGWYWPGEIRGSGNGYWSSTPFEYWHGDTTSTVWLLDFGYAGIFQESKGFIAQAFRCVRG